MPDHTSKYTDEVLSHIMNETCQTFFFEDRDLILYFGPIIENKPLKTAWQLWIGCPWRLYKRGQIVAAYFDDAEKVRRETLSLEQTTLTHIECVDISKDLYLTFDNGLQLEVFTDSVMYELWELRGANGYKYEMGPNLTAHERMENAGNS